MKNNNVDENAVCPIRIGILGINGRMGKMLVQAILKYDAASQQHCVLSAAIGRKGSKYLGQDAGSALGLDRLNVVICSDLKNVIDHCDVIIDFTTEAALEQHLEICKIAKKAFVIGITGLSNQLMQQICEASKVIPIIHSGNYSLGVNLTVRLVELATHFLGQSYDVDILEAHHRHKIDAPSGTALMFAEAIESIRKTLVNQNPINQNAISTKENLHPNINLHAIRGGDIVGEHEVSFFGNGEIISIKHIAYDRINFATGSIPAAIWLADQSAGLYDMQNVIKY